jgi:hypothetical protein
MFKHVNFFLSPGCFDMALSEAETAYFIDNSSDLDESEYLLYFEIILFFLIEMLSTSS